MFYFELLFLALLPCGLLAGGAPPTYPGLRQAYYMYIVY